MKNNLHRIRKKKKLTQQELATRLGVTRQTIISIENDKYTASLPLALKIAHEFGVPVEEIFILEEDE